MKKRFSFKKITQGDYALCFYCRKFNTHFALYDKKDESEVFCCPTCALKVAKLKKLKKLLGKSPEEQEKTILLEKSRIKKEGTSRRIGGLEEK